MVVHQLFHLAVDIDNLSFLWLVEHEVIIQVLILLDRRKIKATVLVRKLGVVVVTGTADHLGALTLRKVEVVKVLTEVIAVDDDLIDLARQ